VPFRGLDKDKHLLATDGTKDNQRQGKLGILLHDTSKWMIKSFISALHNKMKPVIKYKLENGWINPSIEQFYKDWTWVIELDEKPEHRGIGGFGLGDKDPNRIMFYKMRDIGCVILDEDTHYAIRMMMVLNKIHDNWKEYEIQSNQANALFKYMDIYTRLKDLEEIEKQDKIPLKRLDDAEDTTDSEGSRDTSRNDNG